MGMLMRLETMFSTAVRRFGGPGSWICRDGTVGLDVVVVVELWLGALGALSSACSGYMASYSHPTCFHQILVISPSAAEFGSCLSWIQSRGSAKIDVHD